MRRQRWLLRHQRLVEHDVYCHRGGSGDPRHRCPLRQYLLDVDGDILLGCALVLQWRERRGTDRRRMDDARWIVEVSRLCRQRTESG